MFIGKYELENKIYNNIYYKNKNGYVEWNQDIFSPLTKNIEILDFKIEGESYKDKKDNLEEIAKNWQCNFSSLSWSYGEIATICDFFEKNGKRYGLFKIFKENCIC